ncbi:hypothetical protein [Emticicia sp. SJ17W-69]|uniref:hypothetical protein n=1 Tax=Emticicia sp. SJ17W-69 TaxID=3421657 RepID=UPI003EB9AA72
MTLLASILSIFSSFDWLIYLALIVILGLQIWLISKASSITKQRKKIRLALNLLLWIVILLFVIQPQWKSPVNTGRVLLISENVPAENIKHVKDSLKITESFSTKDFQQRLFDDPTFVEHLGNIYLLGEDFEPEVLSQLRQKQVIWLPFFEKNELQDIRWKGIVRKGDIQEIAGEIELSEENTLKINYENQILDSVLLKKGLNRFKLHFPIFSIGRTETALKLGEKALHKIVFFSRKNTPIAIQFILENPDFESKSLAEWLGKNGNHVEITTTVAKNTQNQTSINKLISKEKFAPNIVITDPSNASNPIVKKVISEGKSILFLNLTNPEQELKTINLTLGSHYFAKKTTNEDFIKISENLTALPYRFEEKPNQKNVLDYPVAIQKNVGKVGVSLLNETFPLKLSGDSLTYGKLWTSIFQQLYPSFQDNIEVLSPIFQDTKATISLNNRLIAANDLKISNDTISLETSAMNSLSSETDFVFRKTGWQSLQDSLEIYVEENPTILWKSKQIDAFLTKKSKMNAPNSEELSHILNRNLPDWAWFLLILFCLTAVWVEPKL